MKQSFLRYLCCPKCGDDFHLTTTAQRRDEVWTGSLGCKRCRHSYPVERGIPVILEGKALADFHKTRRNWENWWKKVRDESDVELYDRLWTEAERNLGGEPLYRKEDFAGKIVLDAGCGNGRHLRSDFSKFGCKEIIAVDLGMQVYLARERNKGLKNVHYLQADLTQLPLKKLSVEVIASHGVLHHTPEPAKTFAHLAARLKKNGVFALYVYHKEWAHFSAHRKSLLLDALYANGVLIWQSIRKVTSRLPHPLLLPFCYTMAAKSTVEHALQSYKFTRPLGRLLQLIPPFAYIGINFHERLVRNYDHYSATFNYFFAEEEVIEWYRANGFDDLEIVSVPVSIRGRKRRTHPMRNAAISIHLFPFLDHFRFRSEWERLYNEEIKRAAKN